MSWPTKNTLICHQDVADANLEAFAKMGWKAHTINDVDCDKVKGYLA